jgi:thiamine transport system permease protein
MQLLVSGLVLWGYLVLEKRHGVGLRPRVELRSLAPVRAWPLSLGMWGFFGLLYAPLLALLLRGFAHPQAFVSVWASPDFTPAGLALGNTLKFAGLALLLVLPLGMIYAYAVWRGSRILNGLGLLPLVISPVAVGLGYLLAYPGLRGSLLLLIMAYGLLSYPLLARVLAVGLRAMPRSIGEAARVLGASALRRFWRVELPILAPALASGGALALVAVMGEFGATLVLQRPEWATLSVAIYERLGRPGTLPFAEAMALALILVLMSGATLITMTRWGRES